MNHTVPGIITIPIHSLFESNLTMVINAMSTTIFLGNFYHSCMMIKKNRKPIYYLCLVQSFVALIVNITIMFTFFSFNVGCTFRIIFSASGNLISTSAIEAILLIKARLVSDSLHPLFSHLGAALLGLKSGAFVVNMVCTEVVLTPLYNCGAIMSQITASVAVILELLVNIYLSTMFVIIIYRQWKFVKTPFYKTLIKDGIAFSLVTTSTSIMVVVLTFFQVLGTNSASLFNISWAIQSLLIVFQLRHAIKVRERSKNKQDSGKSNYSSSNTQQVEEKRYPEVKSQFSYSEDILVIPVQHDLNFQNP